MSLALYSLVQATTRKIERRVTRVEGPVADSNIAAKYAKYGQSLARTQLLCGSNFITLYVLPCLCPAVLLHHPYGHGGRFTQSAGYGSVTIRPPSHIHSPPFYHFSRFPSLPGRPLIRYSCCKCRLVPRSSRLRLSRSQRPRCNSVPNKTRTSSKTEPQGARRRRGDRKRRSTVPLYILQEELFGGECEEYVETACREEAWYCNVESTGCEEGRAERGSSGEQ